jgi:hypothetical protein
MSGSTKARYQKVASKLDNARRVVRTTATEVLLSSETDVRCGCDGNCEKVDRVDASREHPDALSRRVALALQRREVAKAILCLET